MTVHALLLDPPREGLVLPELAETTPLSPGEAAGLYAAMAKDAIRATAESGGDLLVNYRAEEDLAIEGETDAEAEVRALVADVLDPTDVRFEVQVGSSFASRAGNTATHLLHEEDEAGVAIIDPRAPTISRRVLDGAAMKLRSSEVVIGPAPNGRAPYFGLVEPIDFEGAYGFPAVETLARRGVEAGLSVDFVEMHPVIETSGDLATLLTVVDARLSAGRWVPEHTADCLDELDLGVREGGDGPEVVRE